MVLARGLAKFAGYVALDLDPMPDVTFAQVLDVARWIATSSRRSARSNTRRQAPMAHIYIPLRPIRHPTPACSSADRRDRRLTKHRSRPLSTFGQTARAPRASTSCRTYQANGDGVARTRQRTGVSSPLSWREVDEAWSASRSRSKPCPGDSVLSAISGRLSARRRASIWHERRAGQHDDATGNHSAAGEDDLADILRIYNQAIEKTTAVFEYRPHTLGCGASGSKRNRRRPAVLVAVESEPCWDSPATVPFGHGLPTNPVELSVSWTSPPGTGNRQRARAASCRARANGIFTS